VQAIAQRPELQICPAPQAALQVPQWSGSLAGSTQALPHRSWPGGQTQLPPTQAPPVGQL
jgi:hypothetical protein